MPDLVSSYISQVAELEGYNVRCFDIGVTTFSPVSVVSDPLLPTMMPIDGRVTQVDPASELELGVNIEIDVPAIELPDDTAELGVHDDTA